MALGALSQQPKLTTSQGAARPCRIFFLSRFLPVLESGARLVTKRDKERHSIDENERSCLSDTEQLRLRAEVFSSATRWSLLS